MADQRLFAPLATLEWVDRNLLKPNDYNPNKVSRENLKLLTQSILTNGWSLPIVVREDYTIIDGFHRWTVAGEEPLITLLGWSSGDRADLWITLLFPRGKGTVNCG